MTVIVTGGNGFIGRHLCAALRARGDDVIVAEKGFDWSASLGAKTVYHMGAITDTTVDWLPALKENFEFSRNLLSWCTRHHVALVYASSASVYGNSLSNREWIDDAPLNAYAWSKYLFDSWCRSVPIFRNPRSIGFRFFNVYGSGEESKGRMASPVHQFAKQIRETGRCAVFEDPHKTSYRDFVHVSDVVKILLWANEAPSGVYNVGTGLSYSFRNVAKKVIDVLARGEMNVLSFPATMNLDAYQWHTCADLTRLRAAGYKENFLTLEEGVRDVVGAVGL